MFKGIIEASELPEQEKIYLKKDIFGYRVVEPPKQWYHWIIGSKRNLFILIILLVIASLFYVGIKEIVSGCKEMASNPCVYCNTNIPFENRLSNRSFVIVGDVDGKET